jgi:hypothetical protein
MKVYIGSFVGWFGPYQLAEKLKYFGVGEDLREAIGERLSGTWLNRFLNWTHEKKTRKIKIRIDKYDTWNMDHTLSLIILPMLKKMKEEKHGYPRVDKEDVPEHLWVAKEPDEDDFQHSFQSEYWDWVLDEMIWAFEQKVDDDADSKFYNHPKEDNSKDLLGQIRDIKVDVEGMNAWQKRKSNAFRLFGKYFENLWT